MSNKEIYCWVCDYSKITGEGNLARQYIKYLNKTFDTKIIKIDQFSWLKSNSILKKIINYKYILPFFGVFIMWVYFIKRKNCCYVNYLPLWNFLLFILLPPNIQLGPITGGALYSKNSKNYFLRKYLFNFFYYLSSLVIILKQYDKIYFTTNLLKKKINKSLRNKSKFNFIYKMIQKEPKNRILKKIDILIYYKKHENKIHLFPSTLIKKLLLLNLTISVIGDRLNISGVKNYGYVYGQRKKIIFNKSKFILSSSENVYTVFTLEAINHNLKILINKNNSKFIDKYKSSFIVFDFNKYQILNFFLSQKKHDIK